MTAGDAPPVRPQRWRPRLPSWLVPLVIVLTGTAAVLGAGGDAAPAGSTRQADDPSPADLVAEGRALYMTSCVSCHGPDGEGQRAPNGALRGPSLEETGEAGAHYQLTTGRMPLGNPDDLPQRKEPAYSPEEIEAIVAFVGTITEGPAVPTVDPASGDLARGGELYRENCAACHSATGAGGALSYGQAAPPLGPADPSQIGAAVRSGPDPMPRFGPEILGDDDLDSVIRYVEYLDEPDDRGGLALGRLGPIPEGFMVWVGGLGLLLVASYFMGTRWASAPQVDPVPPGEPDPDDRAEAAPVSSTPDAVNPEDDPVAEPDQDEEDPP